MRYLQENGGEVEAGQPFVEVEAMKMIMPLKSSESGKIIHNLSPGTVISAGDLLATLSLKDPSKVKKIIPFSGDFDVDMKSHSFTPADVISNILAGYNHDPDSAVAAAFHHVKDIQSASDVVITSLSEFVRVEKLFDDKLLDDVVRQMAKDNADNLNKVIMLNQAHQQLARRSRLVLALLREVETFSDRFQDSSLPQELLQVIGQIAHLHDKKTYGEVTLAAENIIRQSKIPPFDTRIEELRKHLLDNNVDLVALSKDATLSAGVDLLTSLFKDRDSTVKTRAVEVFVRRVYRAHRIINLKVQEIDGRMDCSWSFRFADVPESQSVVRHGILSVISSTDDLESELPKILTNFGSTLDSSKATASDGAVNVVHIATAGTDDCMASSVESIEKAFISQEKKLNMLGVRTVNLIIPVTKKDPIYYAFPQCMGFKEDPLRRNMRPTFHHLLELGRLDQNFALERIPAIGKNSQVYIGTEKGSAKRGAGGQVLFVRGVSNMPGLVSLHGARRSLIQGLDELERAQANPKVSPDCSSRIFLHSLPELEGITPDELAKTFFSVMDTLKSKLSTRLLKYRVDEIEVKVRVASKDHEGKPVIQPVRLVASSMEGEWLKPIAFLEKPDPVTGVTREFCLLGDSEKQACYLDPYAASNVVQTKRAIARRVGSTYAYDFLGLLEVGLIDEWDNHLKSLQKQIGGDGISEGTPSGIFSAQELLEDASGNVAPGSRAIGTNKVGMVAWLVHMKTPEYPDGRDIVFIANDVTVQSGSFGVQEDDMYFKASKYARERGLPRVYIACNAGARIGLVDELKSKIKIKFYDDASPAKGFEYLYLTDADYEALPKGTVNAHKVPLGWAIDDIIGTTHGIGVENLRGSGMIAGETSRAYDEIFTLSYVTGRSVGIGAYLVRLGQRVIQMQQGPMILTGYSALNKLLGREVYTSQDQLGGPQIMFPNGVSHEIVENDQSGVASILKWLSFVPKRVGALPACRDCAEPVDRDVVYRPTPTPYDPRLMLSGRKDEPGFFDEGSFKEYLAGWGKSVVVGRGRLGGIPMGAIAVETRLVDKVIPADPADPNSREAILPQAGMFGMINITFLIILFFTSLRVNSLTLVIWIIRTSSLP